MMKFLKNTILCRKIVSLRKNPMCGRYSFAALAEEVENRFHIKIDGSTWKVRYNCAPTQELAVITNEEPGKISYLRWGLIPSWAKDAAIGNKLINARSESAAEKPAFKNSISSRRCLVLSNGFYEWKKVGKIKIPMFITLKEHPLFAMAGICDRWSAPGDINIETFSILTMKPNEIMSTIHNRMPVILSPSIERKWLETSDPEMQKKLCISPNSSAMQMHQVSTLVNSPATDHPDLIRPVGGEQASLF